MYTTFGAPSGAGGGSNGDQSGTESRMSTLIVPLNCLLTAGPSRSAAPAWPLGSPLSRVAGGPAAGITPEG